MALPGIDALWVQYPQGTPEDVAALIGGAVANNIRTASWETCCIRISRALNYSGVPVTGFAGMANPYMTDGKVRASPGGDSKWYIFSTYDLRVYLTVRFGQPKLFKGTADEKTVAGVPGIIMFGWRHVDLWDGSKVCHLALFGHASAVTNGVLIWPTPKT